MIVPPSQEHTPRVRKHLSADFLYKLLRLGFAKIPDHRGRKCPIPLPDALMSALAMFALKDPSLLAFEERRNDDNLGNLFGIAHVPSDTHLREILDPVPPRQLRPCLGQHCLAGAAPPSTEAKVWHSTRSAQSALWPLQQSASVVQEVPQKLVLRLSSKTQLSVSPPHSRSLEQGWQKVLRGLQARVWSSQ